MTLAAVCHFCHHEFAVDINARRSLPRVTSDCRPAARTGALVVCPSCCLTQTVVADDWRAAADAAYRDYAIYEAGGRCGAKGCIGFRSAIPVEGYRRALGTAADPARVGNMARFRLR